MNERELLIHGPTDIGSFFIADRNNNVFDGRCWRGFGMARQYPTFREAFVAARKLAEAEFTATR